MNSDTYNIHYVWFLSFFYWTKPYFFLFWYIPKSDSSSLEYLLPVPILLNPDPMLKYPSQIRKGTTRRAAPALTKKPSKKYTNPEEDAARESANKILSFGWVSERDRERKQIQNYIKKRFFFFSDAFTYVLRNNMYSLGKSFVYTLK